MPTLMSEATFNALVIARDHAEELAPGQVGNVMVPWVGDDVMRTHRGLYVVGIASDKTSASAEQNFHKSLQEVSQFVKDLPRIYSPFWQFINQLSEQIFHQPAIETSSMWGWSNLLKIGGTDGVPIGKLVEAEREACIIALTEEIGYLRNSLIVITSDNPYGILHEVTAPEVEWDRELRKGGTYFRFDEQSGNAFVHAYHPKHMKLAATKDDAVADVMNYYVDKLNPFGV